MLQYYNIILAAFKLCRPLKLWWWPLWQCSPVLQVRSGAPEPGTRCSSPQEGAVRARRWSVRAPGSKSERFTPPCKAAAKARRTPPKCAIRGGTRALRVKGRSNGWLAGWKNLHGGKGPWCAWLAGWFLRKKKRLRQLRQVDKRLNFPKSRFWAEKKQRGQVEKGWISPNRVFWQKKSNEDRSKQARKSTRYLWIGP